MAPATAYVTSSMVQTPQLQQQLQQRIQQQRQTPVSQQLQGQQRSQQYYFQHQQQQHQYLQQHHAIQQQKQALQHHQAQQQQQPLQHRHAPHQERNSQQQHHVQVNQLLLLMHQPHVQKQPPQEVDARDAFYGFTCPIPVSPPSDQEDATAGAASPVLLSHNSASWHLGRINQESDGCLADSIMLAAPQQQANNIRSSDKPPAIPPVYFSCSGVAAAGTAAPPAILTGRKESKPSLSPSCLGTLSSSGSAISDASTSPGDGSVFASASAASVESSPASPLHFIAQPSAATEDVEDSLSSNTPSRTTTSGEQQHQQRVRTQQQARNQSQQQQHARSQHLVHLSHRHPLPPTGYQPQQRCPRQQRGIAAVDGEPAGTARQLRYGAAATPPTPGMSRFKYGSRSSIGSHAPLTRQAGNRRPRHQVRQQQDQRAQPERQRQQPLPQHAHCRCTSAEKQQRHQPGGISENALRGDISSYPSPNLMSTGSPGTAAALSATGCRSACEDLPLSTDGDCKASRQANTDEALLHRVQGRHASSSCSSSSLRYIPGVGGETLARTAADTRGLGFPSLPYLHYDLRAVGGVGWPPPSLSGRQRTPRNGPNPTVRLPHVASSDSVDATAKTTVGREPLASAAPVPYEVHACSPLHDAAGATAMCGYPQSARDHTASNSGACLLLDRSSINRTVAVAAQQADKSTADAAAAAAEDNGHSDEYSLRGKLAYNGSAQHRRIGLLPQDMCLTSGTEELQMVFRPGANCCDSSMYGRTQPPTSRARVAADRSKHKLEQQPTVTLPLLCGPTVPKQLASETLGAKDFQLPCSSLLATARTTRVTECGSHRVKSGCFGQVSTAAFPSSLDNFAQLTSCKAQAGGVAPRAGRVLSPVSGNFTSAVEPTFTKGGPVAKTPAASVIAPVSEACACSSSGHIGRGRGPGGSDATPVSHSSVVASNTAAATINDVSVKAPRNGNGQPTSDLERTWLKLLCESEAVAEGKVRTCRSSAPIPPAVLLRAPEKLEGHVISSSSRDIIRPSFYSIVEEDDAGTGGRSCGADGPVGIAALLMNRKAIEGGSIDDGQSCTRQRQVSASSNAASNAGGSGDGEAAIAVVETLHLEKLLQSAIYGAVFRANLHTVFRTTRASKKPRQGDDDGQNLDSGCSFDLSNSSICLNKSDKNNAHAETPCNNITKTPVAVTEWVSCERGDASEKVDSPTERQDCFQEFYPQQVQNKGNVGENSDGEAIGSIELRSQIVAVKVLSLSLQVNASPSLQEDFLSELKFYPYLKGHKNILIPHRIYVDRTQQLLMLIFPFAEFEDLFEVLKKRKKPFAEAEVQWICKQLLQAVLFLHQRGIAMRDLSLENVLICRCPETGFAVPKLTDPGQAVIADRNAAAATRIAAVVKRCSTAGEWGVYRGPQVTLERRVDAVGGRERCGVTDAGRVETAALRPLRDSDNYEPPAVFLAPDKIFGKSFRPPEVYQQCSYNPFKVDSFCMGWMTYYLLTKQQLFQRAAPSDDNWRLLSTKNASDLLLLLGRKNGAVLSVEGLDFVVRLLEDDPERRMTIYQALSHPFIALSKPRPVLADNLFPEDAVTQEQHAAKQRHFHMHLLRQKRSLLQLYKLRWGNLRALKVATATEEPPQKQGQPIQSEHRQPLQSGNSSAHTQKMACEMAVPSTVQRTSPCQTLLRKHTQSHKRQTSQQQQQEHEEELWHCRSHRMLSKSRDGGAVHGSSREQDTHQNNLEQSLFLQTPVHYCFSECSTYREPPGAAVDNASAVVQEEPRNGEPAPTLLLQHSTLLRRSSPTPSTPYRWWSAGILPNTQKVPPPCGSPRQDPSECEKQNVHCEPQASWGLECGRGTCDIESPVQHLRQGTSKKNEREPQFSVQKVLPHTTAVAVDTRDVQAMNNSASLPIEKTPDSQRLGVCAENFRHVNPQQRLPPERTSESSFFPRSTARGEQMDEAIRDDVCTCQAEPVLLAPAITQFPTVSSGFASLVEQQGSAQPQCKRPFLEGGPMGQQALSDNRTVHAMASQPSTHKQLHRGSAGTRQVPVQEENESKTAMRLAGLSEAERGFTEKTRSCPDSGTVAGDVFPPEESTTPVKDNFQASVQVECNTAGSDLTVQPSVFEDTNKDSQPSALLSHKKTQPIGCMHASIQPSKCTSTDEKPEGLAGIERGISTIPTYAPTRKGCKDEGNCKTEVQRNVQEGSSGQCQRKDPVTVKTVNSSFGKGRRGPSSSSTETGSTAGENGGGRSDSDYCVGARSSGSISHFNRDNVSCVGPQRYVVRIPLATSLATSDTGRSRDEHEMTTFTEGLWMKSTDSTGIQQSALSCAEKSVHLCCSRRHDTGNRREMMARCAAPNQSAVEAENHEDVGSAMTACPNRTAGIEHNPTTFRQLNNAVRDSPTCSVSSLPIRVVAVDAKQHHIQCSRGFVVASACAATCKSRAVETPTAGSTRHDEPEVLAIKHSTDLSRYGGVSERDSFGVATIAEAEYPGWRTCTNTHGLTSPRSTPATRYPSF